MYDAARTALLLEVTYGFGEELNRRHELIGVSKRCNELVFRSWAGDLPSDLTGILYRLCPCPIKGASPNLELSGVREVFALGLLF